MGTERQDGSIKSANTPSFDTMEKNIDLDYGIYRCMVMATYFVYAPGNPTYENQQVVYDVMVLGGPKEGQIFKNAKSVNVLGGEYNYSEHVWRPNDVTITSGIQLSDLTGDIVHVGFLQGNSRYPIILGGGVQPNDADFTGATTDDGYRSIKQYNGIFTEIDKSGNYTLRRKGGTVNSATGVFEPDESGDLASIQLRDQQIITKVGDNISSVIDGAAQTVTITFAGGMTVTVDGDADSAKIKSSAGGEINISEDKIAIGNNTAELFDQLTQTLQKLITFLNSTDATHSHTGNLGYPVSPPLSAAQFVELATELTTINTALTAIKGSL